MYRLLFISTILFLASCSNELPETNTPAETPDETVRIYTRVDGESVAADVNAGLYMVNYLNGTRDKLLPTNNYVNNQMLTYANNVWSTSKPIYWSDDVTPADFYAYAPYQREVPDACALAFNVQKDQTTLEAKAQSDFLWGMLPAQSPTSESFNMELSHMLCQLTVKVTCSEDFADSMEAKDISVVIGGTKTGAMINLATGVITPDGETGEVKCHNNGDLSYTAILIPQQVPFSNLLQIVWNGNPFTLQSAFKLEAKRQYTLTVKLKKTQSGFDAGIDGWEIIDEDFGGVVGGN